MTKFTDSIPSKKESQKTLTKATDELAAYTGELKAIEDREVAAQKSLGDLKQVINSLRISRQNLLVAEKDTAAIDKQLEETHKEASRLEDLISGLIKVIADKSAPIAGLQEAVEKARVDFGKFDLFVLYDRYNEAAQALAEIVAAIHEKRYEAGKGVHHVADADVNDIEYKMSALNNIPKLIPENEQKLRNGVGGRNPEECCFWDSSTWLYNLRNPKQK